MFVVIGAVIGAVVTLVLTVGFMLLPGIIPPLMVCNCGCCFWPAIGAAIGAIVAVRMSSSGGGAGKGAGVGFLAGGGAAMALAVVMVVFAASMAAMVPRLWGSIRNAMTDDVIEKAVNDVPEPTLKTDLADILKKMREKESFEGAYGELQTWLTDERINGLVDLYQGKPGMSQTEIDKGKAQAREALQAVKTMSYQDAMQKAGPALSELKKGLLVSGSFFLFVLFGLFVVSGVVGGVVAGAMFGVEPMPATAAPQGYAAPPQPPQASPPPMPGK